MATLNDRAGSRSTAVNSLIGQVDRLTLTNGEKIGDAAKFASCANAPDVFLGVDDDLIYPPDYVKVTLGWLREFPGCVVSYHGWVAGKDGDHAENYRCMEELAEPVDVDVVGTGVCAFSVSTIRPMMADFPLRNQADLWFALKAEREGIRRVVVPHPERWFGYTEWPRTIWTDTAFKTGSPLDGSEAKRAALRELLPLVELRHPLEPEPEDEPENAETDLEELAE